MTNAAMAPAMAGHGTKEREFLRGGDDRTSKQKAEVARGWQDTARELVAGFKLEPVSEAELLVIEQAAYTGEVTSIGLAMTVIIAVRDESLLRPLGEFFSSRSGRGGEGTQRIGQVMAVAAMGRRCAASDVARRAAQAAKTLQEPGSVGVATRAACGLTMEVTSKAKEARETTASARHRTTGREHVEVIEAQPRQQQQQQQQPLQRQDRGATSERSSDAEAARATASSQQEETAPREVTCATDSVTQRCEHVPVVLRGGGRGAGRKRGGGRGERQPQQRQQPPPQQQLQLPSKVELLRRERMARDVRYQGAVAVMAQARGEHAHRLERGSRCSMCATL